MRPYVVGSLHSNGLVKELLGNLMRVESLAQQVGELGGGIILHYDPVKMRDNGECSQVLRMLEDENPNLSVVGSTDQLNGALTVLRDDVSSVDDLVIALLGGDGVSTLTNTEIVNVWGDETPYVTFLGGGTMTTTKKNCGIKGRDPFANLDALCEVASGAKPVSTFNLDLLCVDDGDKLRYGGLVGFGFPVNLLASYYSKAGIPTSDEWMKSGKSSPLYGALFVLRGVGSSILYAATFGRAGKFLKFLRSSTRASVSVDGEPAVEKDYLGVLCGAFSDVGLGFHALYHAGQGGGFHVCVAGADFNPASLVPNIPRIRAGKEIMQPFSDASFPPDVLDNRLTQDTRIVFPKPTVWQLDGEFNKSRELHVTQGPTVRVINGHYGY